MTPKRKPSPATVSEVLLKAGQPGRLRYSDPHTPAEGQPYLPRWDRLNVPDPGAWAVTVSAKESKTWLSYTTEDGSWIVTCGVEAQGNQPVVSWMDIAPVGDSTPAGGIGSRTLHGIRLGEALRTVFPKMQGDALLGHLASLQGFEDQNARSPRIRDRVLLAEIARDYVAEVQRAGGRRGRDAPIIPKLHEKHEGLSLSRIRDLVWHARREGFLTPAPKNGIPGGELTDDARRVLASARKPTAKKPAAKPTKGK